MGFSRTVLIVDDEADIREVAQLSLEINTDWQVIAAGSGQEALQVAASQQPNAILLDVMMPELDGPATWQLLQQNPATKNIPVIFLTAKTQAKEQRRYAELGVNAVISKPFDPVTLADSIAQALGWTF